MKLRGGIRTIAVALAIAWFSTLLIAQRHDVVSPQDPEAVRLGTDLVSFNVTVTNQRGQTVSTLRKQDFRIYENGFEQKIDFFGPDEAPVSWGLVLDCSGSMKAMINGVYRAAIHILDYGSNEDETFAVTFSSKVVLTADFTSDHEQLQRSLQSVRATGSTSLWDAVAYAIDHLQLGKHQKRVLVVVTDGEDNNSRISYGELTKKAQEANVLIYTVGMFERGGWFGSQSRKENYSRQELQKLSDSSGATAHFPDSVGECETVMREIALEVSRQYSLGYYPSNPIRNNQWRKLNVEATPIDSKDGRLIVRARNGYYYAESNKKP